MTQSMTSAASRWKRTSLGLAVALVGLVLWDGADRRAADATQPLPQSLPSSARRIPPQNLKVGSFNIHGGKGTDGVRSLPRTAELLSDVDFVGLYEVRAAFGMRPSNQAAAVAEACQGAWLFAPTERQWWSDHFGNGLMYHIPIHSNVRVPLVNTRGKAYRNAILSTVELQHANVQIVSVHIDREHDRRDQLQTVIDLFLSLQEPCVLMGDLNTIATDALLVRLREQRGVQSPLHESLPNGPPIDNIDWIFTRGLRTVSAKLVENTASDHPLLQAELAPLE